MSLRHIAEGLATAGEAAGMFQLFCIGAGYVLIRLVLLIDKAVIRAGRAKRRR